MPTVALVPGPLRVIVAAALFVAALGRVALASDLGAYLPPRGAAYVAEEVRIRSPGRGSLAGTLTLPTRGVLRDGRILRYPAMLLLNRTRGLTRDGSSFEEAERSSPDYRPMFELADTLTRRDVAVLRLDDRGVGASTGRSDSTTALDRSDDARAAVAFLRRRSDIDPHRVAIFGVGEGAAIAAFIADTDPGLRAVVLMAVPAKLVRPGSIATLVLPADPDVTTEPASADALMRAERGRVADWTAATLGGAEAGPRPPAPRLRRRRRR